MPQPQYLYNRLASLANYFIFAREWTLSPVGKFMLAQEWTCLHGQRLAYGHCG